MSRLSQAMIDIGLCAGQLEAMGAEDFAGVEGGADVFGGRTDVSWRGEVRAVVGQHDMDLVENGFDQPAQEVGGGAAADVCEVGWQDVVQGHDGRCRITDERGALFVKSGRPITPNTMAIHHILDEQVAGAPYWKTVAPHVLRPPGGVAALAAHRGAFEQRYCRPQFTGGAGWVCTWKCALRFWPELPRFSNQMLR